MILPSGKLAGRRGVSDTYSYGLVAQPGGSVGERSYNHGLVAHSVTRATPFPRPASKPRTRWEDHTSSPHPLSLHFYTSYNRLERGTPCIRGLAAHGVDGSATGISTLLAFSNACTTYSNSSTFTA